MTTEGRVTQWPIKSAQIMAQSIYYQIKYIIISAKKSCQTLILNAQIAKICQIWSLWLEDNGEPVVRLNSVGQVITVAILYAEADLVVGPDVEGSIRQVCFLEW
jgi:hypothetical protein